MPPTSAIRIHLLKILPERHPLNHVPIILLGDTIRKQQAKTNARAASRPVRASHATESEIGSQRLWKSLMNDLEIGQFQRIRCGHHRDYNAIAVIETDSRYIRCDRQCSPRKFVSLV